MESSTIVARMSQGEPTTPAKPFNSRQVTIGNAVIKVMSRCNTWIYRTSKGRMGTRFVGGAPVALFTTIGRKSNQRRTVPLLYLKDGADLVIVASKGGMPHHPEWYLNVRSNPAVSVEINGRSYEATATELSDDERLEMWPRLVDMYKSFDAYQSRTERTIPVLRVTPTSN